MFDPLHATNMETPLTDNFGRKISYLRLSVTDRCDLRCSYCMAEDIRFLPRDQLLTLEEMATLCDSFIARGVTQIRLTGGEPLTRKNILFLVRMLGERLGSGLEQLTMTTNATLLAPIATQLAAAGMRRLNISLDSLDRDIYAHIARRDALSNAMTGIKAASHAGLKVKINMVLMRGVNDQQVPAMIDWCLAGGHDLTLIETMPMGGLGDKLGAQYVPAGEIIKALATAYDLKPSSHRTAGPARYYDIGNSGQKLGVITPLSDNFCAGCNRVRVTCTGKIYLCLGQEDSLDLKAALRKGGRDALNMLLDQAMTIKPERHNFAVGQGLSPVLAGGRKRSMSVTGG